MGRNTENKVERVKDMSGGDPGSAVAPLPKNSMEEHLVAIS